MVQVYQPPTRHLAPIVYAALPLTELTIAAAITSAQTLYPTGCIVSMAGGQGDITPTTSTSPAVRVRSDNIELEAGPGTRFLSYPGSAQHTWFLIEPSSLSSGPAALLTANLDRYTKVATIGAGVPAVWAAEDIIELQQTEYAAGQADGFLCLRVRTKDATHATFYEDAPTPFTTARTAVGVKLSMLKNATCRGIKGDGSGNTNDFTCLIAGINVQNFKMFDCEGTYFKGGMLVINTAYEVHLERCSADYCGFDDNAGNQLAGFGITNATHVTRKDCHANMSPGEGFLDWALAYLTVINDQAIGPYNRGQESHSVWSGRYIGCTYNDSWHNVGVVPNGCSFNVKYIDCTILGNSSAGVAATDTNVISDEVWFINCVIKGTTQSAGGNAADIVLGTGSRHFYFINCVYDSIFDNSTGSYFEIPKSISPSVLFVGSALKSTNATPATEQTIVPATFLGPGLAFSADFFNKPRQLRLKLKGAQSNNNTDTIRIRVKTGAGVVLLDTTAVTPSSGLTSALWELTADINVYAPGALVDVHATGKFYLAGTGTSGGFKEGGAPMVNAVAPQINTGVAQTLDVTVQYSTNSGSNLLVTTSAEVEVLS